jgi:hypothetical protein
MRKPIKGWRLFRCEECQHEWKLATRDYNSPSGENCPKCDEWEFPYFGEPDDSIPSDKMGNLTVPWDWNGEALENAK